MLSHSREGKKQSLDAKAVTALQPAKDRQMLTVNRGTEKKI